jgi:hypothetical protein
MRHAVPVLLALLAPFTLAACASPGAPVASKPTLHPSECLDPSRARGWTHVDDTTLLVDAGQRKYRVNLAESCFALGTSPDLLFSGGGIGNRVCGHVGETVVVGRQRCRIQSVERLDEASYREAAGEDKPRGTVSASTDD